MHTRTRLQALVDLLIDLLHSRPWGILGGWGGGGFTVDSGEAGADAWCVACVGVNAQQRQQLRGSRCGTKETRVQHEP